MGILKKIFNPNAEKKSANIVDEGTCDNIVKWSPRYIDLIDSPYVAGSNFLTMFYSIPEVFWPIDYIASRIAGAKFELKRYKDDSVVWDNDKINNIFTSPNALMDWHELVYSHFVNKLVTGNAYMRAAMADSFNNSVKWKMCDNFWELPANFISIEPANTTVPLYGLAKTDDIIKCYKLSAGTEGGNIDIPAYQIWHDRDMPYDYEKSRSFLKSRSRLSSQHKPISNLIAVYEARNVIYVKRGGLGFLVSQKKDDTGTTALTPEEKADLRKQHFDSYGIGGGQLPYGISDAPISFVQTNLSIKDLEPFDETLLDAISIAGALGIPAVLVPRKDQSTFANQATAEKSVYTSIVIPMATKFCEGLTRFLGLTESGLYIDCNFSGVDCLQQGLKEAEEVKKLINDRCSAQFDKGIITLNDWRAQIHESKIEGIPLFDKLKFQMNENELATVRNIFNTMTGGNANEGGNQKPAIQD